MDRFNALLDFEKGDNMMSYFVAIIILFYIIFLTILVLL